MEKMLEAMDGQVVTITAGAFTLQMKVRMINIDDNEVELVDGDDTSFTFPRRCMLAYNEGVYYLTTEGEKSRLRFKTFICHLTKLTERSNICLA